MRVAIVSEHASPLAALGGADAGGQNVHVAALAAELANQGHAVVVHTRRDDAGLDTQVRTARGVTVDHVPAGPAVQLPKDELRPWMEDFAIELAERWQRERPEVVHAHFWMSGLASIQAARPLGIPVVQTFHALGTVKRRHQGSADTSPPDRLDTERRLIAEVDHVVATCVDEVSELARYRTSPRGLSVIPCGVDLGLFGPGGPVARRRTGRRLLVIGRLVERKGVADVIRALSSLPEVELLIAGGPSPDNLDEDIDVQRLRALAAELALSGRVHFLGRVERHDLPALIRSALAVVCVPHYEPFGIVPLEAMACGVPVVVSAVGGLRESVVDGQTGLHVAPGEPQRLSEVLARLLSDPALGRRLGRGGARRARELYGWPLVAAKTAEVYEQVHRPRGGSHQGRLIPSSLDNLVKQ